MEIKPSITSSRRSSFQIPFPPSPKAEISRSPATRNSARSKNTLAVPSFTPGFMSSESQATPLNASKSDNLSFQISARPMQGLMDGSLHFQKNRGSTKHITTANTSRVTSRRENAKSQEEQIQDEDLWNQITSRQLKIDVRNRAYFKKLEYMNDVLISSHKQKEKLLKNVCRQNETLKKQLVQLSSKEIKSPRQPPQSPLLMSGSSDMASPQSSQLMSPISARPKLSFYSHIQMQKSLRQAQEKSRVVNKSKALTPQSSQEKLKKLKFRTLSTSGPLAKVMLPPFKRVKQEQVGLLRNIQDELYALNHDERYNILTGLFEQEEYFIERLNQIYLKGDLSCIKMLQDILRKYKHSLGLLSNMNNLLQAGRQMKTNSTYQKLLYQIVKAGSIALHGSDWVKIYMRKNFKDSGRSNGDDHFEIPTRKGSGPKMNQTSRFLKTEQRSSIYLSQISIRQMANATSEEQEKKQYFKKRAAQQKRPDVTEEECRQTREQQLSSMKLTQMLENTWEQFQQPASATYQSNSIANSPLYEQKLLHKIIKRHAGFLNVSKNAGDSKEMRSAINLQSVQDLEGYDLDEECASQEFLYVNQKQTSALAVPIVLESGMLVGVLVAVKCGENDVFSEDDTVVGEWFATQASQKLSDWKQLNYFTSLQRKMEKLLAQFAPAISECEMRPSLDLAQRALEKVMKLEKTKVCVIREYGSLGQPKLLQVFQHSLRDRSRQDSWTRAV